MIVMPADLLYWEDWGIIRQRAWGLNQDGKTVLSFIAQGLARKRNPATPEGEHAMSHSGRMITLTGAEGTEIGAYRVEPRGTPKGGIVLAMEIFGVTDHIKDLCDEFALDGYAVIAPALYDRAERNFQASYSDADIARARKHLEATMYRYTEGDVQAAIDALASDGLTRIHIVGYCYGGSVAWVAACRCEGLTSAVGYYGRHIVDFVAERPQCPVMLHFGTQDKTIPLDWVERIRMAHPDVTIHEYDADHGFNSDRRQNYDAAAAKLARARTLDHFETAGRAPGR